MTQTELHVLFIHLSMAWGEDDQLAFEEVSELEAKGVSWRVILQAGSPLIEKYRDLDSKKIVLLSRPPRKLYDSELATLVSHQIESGRNVVHVFGSDFLATPLIAVLRRLTIPVIVSEGPSMAKRWSHWFQSFFYERIDALLVPSMSLKHQVQQIRPILSKKTRVIHPGLDLDVFNPDHFDFKILRKKWAIDADSFVVGMLASKAYAKAQTAFVKAAASFLRNEELAKRTRFVIVGIEEDQKEELNRLIQQFHLQEQIILAPEEDSIPKVLGSLDVFVMPSSKAVYGMQAIEAMAMGTPIICAQGVEAKEWIGNSGAGLLMRSGDSFDLQRKLRTILEDPENLKQMGMLAVRHARENYDRDKKIDRLLEIYRVLHRWRAQAPQRAQS